MLRAILWDNDGVLVDTEGLYFQAGCETLAQQGVTLTRKNFIEQSLTKGQSVFDFLPDQNPELLARVRAERNARYSDLLRSGVQVLDGVEDVLSALHGRVKMGVVTGSHREHFDIIHEQTGLLRFFDFILVREDYDQPKPYPDAYETAMQKHGLTPDVSLVIEDSERGCKAAVSAGLRVLVVPHELTRQGDFSGAYRMLNHVREAPGVVDDLMAL